MRVLTPAAAIVLAAAGLLATGSGAQAADPVETVTNFDTGACLTSLVTGPPHVRHRVRLDPCDGRPEQAWTRSDPAGLPAAFQLVSAAGKCLVSASTIVTFTDCTVAGAPDKAQYWVEQKLGNGTVRLINLGTGLLLGRDPAAPAALALYSQGLFAPSVMWKVAAA